MFNGKSTISMAMFNSYVKLPEGSMCWFFHLKQAIFLPWFRCPKNHPGLVNIQKAMENGPVEIVDFPQKNGDFP